MLTHTCACYCKNFSVIGNYLLPSVFLFYLKYGFLPGLLIFKKYYCFFYEIMGLAAVWWKKHKLANMSSQIVVWINSVQNYFRLQIIMWQLHSKALFTLMKLTRLPKRFPLVMSLFPSLLHIPKPYICQLFSTLTLYSGWEP